MQAFTIIVGVCDHPTIQHHVLHGIDQEATQQPMLIQKRDPENFENTKGNNSLHCEYVFFTKSNFKKLSRGTKMYVMLKQIKHT